MSLPAAQDFAAARLRDGDAFDAVVGQIVADFGLTERDARRAACTGRSRAYVEAEAEMLVSVLNAGPPAAVSRARQAFAETQKPLAPVPPERQRGRTPKPKGE